MKKRHGEGCAAFVLPGQDTAYNAAGGGVRMQYTVIEFFQSETAKERRRNLERLLQQLRLINGPKDGGTDAPV